MSYMDNFSILDRGDAPAQIVMERNARSLTQRVVDETREELNKVMSRVHTIYGIMESVEETYAIPSMEYLTDMNELEALLQDEIKKRHYQQQVTVFIVGYQDVCQQKLRLIQQVNEFFMENSKSYDEEEWFPTTPDVDSDEVSAAVEDSLNHAHELASRLTELNKDMMSYMLALSDKRANGRGRKKLEKSLQQAKDDVTNLKEKLLVLQTDLQERDDKAQSFFKQLEIKNMDVQKFKTAAELGKQKLIMMQKELNDKQKLHDETKANFAHFLDSQIKALHQSHEQELDELKRIYESTDRHLQSSRADTPPDDHSPKREADTSRGVPGQRNKQDSSPPAKATKMPGKTPATSRQTASKSPVRTKVEHKASNRTNLTETEKVLADPSTRDGRVETSVASLNDRSQAQATKPKPQVKHGPSASEAFQDVFDLLDEEAWADVADDHLHGRFAQYRQMSSQRMQELEEQLQLTTAKTHRKVASLKAQFQEHKNKWEAERKLLIQQVNQSLKFQGDAEREADTVMTQLGDFISQQEMLEHQEEVTRTELIRSSTSITPTKPKIPIRVPTDSVAVTPHPSSAAATTPESEQELQKLMQQTDDAKSQSFIEGANVEDKREEEVGGTPSQSRASLREHYKAKLEEVKFAAESRRSKSPGVNLPTQLTLDEELILHDNDDAENDEMDIDINADVDHKDLSMHDVGTSPLSGLKKSSRDTGSLPRGPSQLSKPSRNSTSLLEHPLLIEYLRTYHEFVNFKEAVEKMFLEKDLITAHQMTSDLATLNFDHSKNILPQVEELTRNVIFVLEELSRIISDHLDYSRTLPVVSANASSREPTEKNRSESLTESFNASRDSRNLSNSQISHLSEGHSRRSSNESEKQLIQELQEQNIVLQQKLEKDEQMYQQQLKLNTSVIEDMQRTIKELQQQLSSPARIGIHARTTINDKVTSPSPESSVMFTRLDSERNAKIMKKAVMEEKLHPEKYKEAVSKMDEYVSLPARRLSNLVKKYIHHVHMKEIEEQVKNSSNMTEEVIHALDKIENLQKQRIRQWAEKMSGMGIERMKLANLLMDTLDTIEQESGIFLIKPMYSYRGREQKSDHISKLSRPVRHRHRRMVPYTESGSSFVPAPSPNTNYYQMKRDQDISQQQQHQQEQQQQHQQQQHQQEQHQQQQHQQQERTITAEVCPKDTMAEQQQVEILGSNLAPNTSLPAITWNVQTIQPWRDQQSNTYNTPKILELDIKRMLIGQNNISSKLPLQPTDDRLTNASQNTLRSYITIQRPPLGGDRPTSGSESIAGVSVQTSLQKVGVSKIDQEVPGCLPSSQPLPPIAPGPEDELKKQEVLKSASVSSSYKDGHELPRKSAGVFHVPV